MIVKRANQLLKYLVASCILAIPLYSKFPFIVVPGTFVAIRIEDFLLAITAVVWLLSIKDELKAFVSDIFTRTIVLYLFVGFVSLLSAIYVTKSVDPLVGLLHAFRRVEYFIPFFAGRQVIKYQRNALTYYIVLFFVVIGVSFIYGLGQRYLSWPIIITQNQEYSKGVALRWVEGSHINATFAGHYDLASFLVLVLPFVVTSYFALKKKMTKMSISIIFFAGLWLMANAVSRISIFSYLVSLVLALIFIKKYRYIIPTVVLSVLVFSMSSTVIVRYTRIYDVVVSEVAKLTYVVKPAYALESTPPPDPRIEDQQPSPLPEDRSSSIRFNVEWPRALRALSKNPFIGTGFSSITLATDNDYLRALGETGVLGFVSFGLVFVYLIVNYLKAFPLKRFDILEQSFLAGSFAALAGIFIIAVFIDIFEASKFVTLFWFIQGMAVALIEQNKVKV